jgi:hypothetical protein
MGPVLSVFLKVILPIFLVAGLGALFQRRRKAPVTVLAQVTLYLFTPALIFDALVSLNSSAGTFLRVAGAMLLATVFVAAAGLAVSVALRHSRPMRSAFLLCAIFPNVGNIALPVTLLAFGEAGFAMGVVIFVVHSTLSWTLGVFIASQSQLRSAAALKQVFKLPMVYAVLAAALVLATGWELPITLARPIELLADGAFPAMLLVLGFHLGSGFQREEWPSLIAALLLRLAVAAPLAYGATRLVGLDGLGQQVVIVAASMPTGVFTTIVSTEFQAHPRFVTSAVVTSTLASLGTLTAVVHLAQRWLG